MFFLCLWTTSLILLSSTRINGDVVHLASNNISQYLENHVTFVKFYSHWFDKCTCFFLTRCLFFFSSGVLTAKNLNQFGTNFLKSNRTKTFKLQKFDEFRCKILFKCCFSLFIRLIVHEKHFFVQITMFLVIQRKFFIENEKRCFVFDRFSFSFSLKLFVRGSGARYEGPRDVNALETFYRQKLTEDATVKII